VPILQGDDILQLDRSEAGRFAVQLKPGEQPRLVHADGREMSKDEFRDSAWAIHAFIGRTCDAGAIEAQVVARLRLVSEAVCRLVLNVKAATHDVQSMTAPAANVFVTFVPSGAPTPFDAMLTLPRSGRLQGVVRTGPPTSPGSTMRTWVEKFLDGCVSSILEHKGLPATTANRATARARALKMTMLELATEFGTSTKVDNSDAPRKLLDVSGMIGETVFHLENTGTTKGKGAKKDVKHNKCYKGEIYTSQAGGPKQLVVVYSFGAIGAKPSQQFHTPATREQAVKMAKDKMEAKLKGGYQAVPVHCVCEQPDTDESGRMFECAGCLKWFHPQCVGVTLPAEGTEELRQLKAFCPSCPAPAGGAQNPPKRLKRGATR